MKMLDIENLRPIMRHGEPDPHTARGRNGWFKLDRIWLLRIDKDEFNGPRIEIHATSKRGHRNVAPIHIELAVEDAVALVSALGVLVQPEDSIPCDCDCHGEVKAGITDWTCNACKLCAPRPDTPLDRTLPSGIGFGSERRAKP